MVNGPPCQQCGYPLRWFAEQNAWGCDRCRQMFPAAPQPMQQQAPMQPQHHPMMGQPQMPYAHAAPTFRGPGAPRRSLMPWIVLGAGAAAGVIIAIVIATGGGGGGGSSPKGIAEDALAALAAGDAEKLAGLADLDNRYKTLVTCDPKEADESAADLAAREKRHYAKAAEKTKGLKLKLVDFPDVDKASGGQVMTIPKGTKIRKGCTSQIDATSIMVAMKVSVQDGDKPAVEREVEVGLAKIDGKYFLAEPPRIEKSADASARMAQMTAFKDQMCACKDAACATKVNNEMTAWAQTTRMDPDEKLSDDDLKKAASLGDDMGKCMQNATTAPVAAPPPPEPTPTLTAADLPKPCQEWKAGIDKLDHCPTIAKATVTALRNSYDRSLAAWSKLSGEARTSVMSSCDSARDAVNNLIKAAGCN